MEVRAHYLLFGIFCVVAVIISETYFPAFIAAEIGIISIVGSIWGLLIGEVLLKLPPAFRKKAVMINIIWFVIGLAFIVYELLFAVH